MPDMSAEANEGLKCAACRTYAFDCARSFALYENEIVRAIVLLKFERIKPLAKWFVARLVKIVAQNVDALGADVVVPVPLHRDREKERG